MASISSLGVGSGLDLNGLLDQLESAERSKLQPIQQQIKTQETRISGYGQFQSALSQFQDAAKALSEPELFDSLATDVQGDAVTAASTSSATPGRYDIEVTQLATAGNLASARVTDPQAELSGVEQTLELSFAGRDAISMTIEAGSSLEAVRDTINANADAGVSASIIFDGTDYRLALSSTETGEDASITGLTMGGALEGEIFNAGQDAQFNVNGIPISSASNQVEEAIEGVTLSLQEGDGATSTITIQRDEDTIRESVTEFVDAFNELKSTIGSLTAFDAEGGTSGALNGESAVRSVENTLRSVLASGSEGGELAMLSDLGISLTRTGTLSIDEEQLNEVISNDRGELAEFFAGGEGVTGLASNVDTTIEQMLDTNGLITTAVTSAENRIESLNDRFARVESSIDSTISRYRTQFGQLDSMISQMNQTSDYLSQQFNMLSAQTQN
ncbi:flagellar filament capping protein FliD [Halomonas qaidamensis]|uniref:Flagellar hook-associated protein 2 n=1 Tax=Halomonas qaidamensis TaxID=2866211 RepID=A0ABY6JQI0_9GAMM|nr:flagellar filament capping protein FliD [Halomonas qaidamensis]UYV18862.1 flagellar filament capping protein FliD [Halomonas qaidamensis]